MERLISDLLDVVSVQTGRLSVRPEPIEPTSLVAEAMAHLELSARSLPDPLADR